jgi:hypothetical protein
MIWGRFVAQCQLSTAKLNCNLSIGMQLVQPEMLRVGYDNVLVQWHGSHCPNTKQ